MAPVQDVKVPALDLPEVGPRIDPFELVRHQDANPVLRVLRIEQRLSFKDSRVGREMDVMSVGRRGLLGTAWVTAKLCRASFAEGGAPSALRLLLRQVLERLQEKLAQVEKELTKIPGAPTTRDVFQLCRGFERAFSYTIEASLFSPAFR